MKNTPFDLTGKVAVITGSSRGIGRSSAELLAKLGAKVVISSRKADACEVVVTRPQHDSSDRHRAAEVDLDPLRAVLLRLDRAVVAELGPQMLLVRPPRVGELAVQLRELRPGLLRHRGVECP